KVRDEVVLEPNAIDLPFKEDLRNLSIAHPIKLDEVNVVERVYVFNNPQVTLSKDDKLVTEDNFEDMAEKYNRTFDMTIESDSVRPVFAPFVERGK
ncbi:MAG: hypothetical protein AAF708_19420, partial [Deinococcota bacterium]